MNGNVRPGWGRCGRILAVLTALPSLPSCSEGAPGGAASAEPGDATEPLYAVVALTFGADGKSFTYVNLVPSMEIQGTVVLDGAREFPEYSPAQAVNGKIVVGSGESPELRRFAVSDSFDWTEEKRLGFSQYSSEPLEASTFIDARKAYVPIETTTFAVYDSETFTIVGEVGPPEEIPLRLEGLKAARGYGQELRDSVLFQPYYWASEDYHEYTESSRISVVDTKEDRVRAVLDTRCPHLHITSRDDDGNLYFSNGQGSIAAAVLNPDHPKNCMVRVKAGEETVDESFTVGFRDLADGREGSNLFYIGEGIAFFNAYHHEREGIGAETEFEDVDYSANYHLWTLDLATMEASMMDGLGFAGGQFVAFHIDERTFVTIPAPDYSSTAVYEVFPRKPAEKRFDVEGWAFNMFRVR